MADGLTISVPNPLSWLFQLPPEPEQKETQEKRGPTYRNEFSRLSYEFVDDLSYFKSKYPLISLIIVVAFGIFAMSSFFSFTFVGLVSAGLYGSVSYTMMKAIGLEGGSYWASLTGSVGQVLQSFALSKLEAD